MTKPAIRPVAAGDCDAWFRLWQGYLEFYEKTLPTEISEATWRRLLDSKEPIHGLVAVSPSGMVVGFANYVLHAATWSEQPFCYLEDLFVAPESRGTGTGRALIEALVDLAKTHGWYRVYWQTKASNATARALYDKIAPVTDWVRYDVNVKT
jgi:GNAT superfamily N-acetyltransferase